MKKVLFVVDKFDMGGLQKVNSVIINALSERNGINVDAYSLQKEKSIYKFNYKVRVFFGESNLYDKCDVFIRKSINKVYKILFKKGTSIVISKQIANLSELIRKNKYDTIVLNGPSLLFSSRLKEIFPNVKLVMWMHNNADKYLNTYFNEYRSLLIDSMSKATIVCLTDEDKDAFSKYSANVKKIWNPLTIENNEISRLNEKVISFVGRMSIEHKGIDYLCQVAARLPGDWKISIAGKGDETSMSKFYQLIEEYNVHDKIVYRGELLGTNLNKHFFESSVYIMTSRWEGFGLVLVEAMSFGLPVIAFMQSGSKEILDGGKFGILIENGNINDMVLHLESLIYDENLRKSFQEKSLKRVKDFNEKSIINKWEEIL
ncbi:glycosyltransferase [Niallia sp. FSL M8-0099]|uniref:glycosyltransferase n=1 Tax=Niallia sp. FSL M8-0099 TaxID=2954519 RepID=UPI0030FB7FD0